MAIMVYMLMCDNEVASYVIMCSSRVAIYLDDMAHVSGVK